MENKYYTPEIEEFHVGFEYEWVKPDRTETIKLECLNNIGFLWGITIPEGVRVKYLDQEDIESLGFKQSKTDKYWYDSKCGRYWVHKESIDDWRWIISDEQSEVSFAGTIKNKSELKRVLKMLNIN